LDIASRPANNPKFVYRNNVSSTAAEDKATTNKTAYSLRAVRLLGMVAGSVALLVLLVGSAAAAAGATRRGVETILLPYQQQRQQDRDLHSAYGRRPSFAVLNRNKSREGQGGTTSAVALPPVFTLSTNASADSSIASEASSGVEKIAQDAVISGMYAL
jgi:hypothetical protein